MAFLNDVLSSFGNALTAEVLNPNLGNSAGGIANTNDATAKAPLGSLLRYDNAVYRYVQFDNGSGNVASVAGGVAVWKTLSTTYPISNDKPEGSFIVTMDITDQISVNAVAGVFGGVVTDGYYTFIQVGGVATAKVASGSAIGDMQIGPGGDGIFAHVDVGGSLTQVCYGVALSAIDTPSTGKSYVLLQNLF